MKGAPNEQRHLAPILCVASARWFAICIFVIKFVATGSAQIYSHVAESSEPQNESTMQEFESEWHENFDSDNLNWTFSGNYAQWRVGLPKASGSQPFSTVSADDVASLVVEGPMQSYRRETATATSPQFEAPRNAYIEFWVGYDVIYDPYCRLSASISSDGFNSSTELWDSRSETNAENGWKWRKISVAIGNQETQAMNLRFTYGAGSEDTQHVGGYLGDFAIDGIKVIVPTAIDELNIMPHNDIEAAIADNILVVRANSDCAQIYSASGVKVTTITLYDSDDKKRGEVNVSTWPLGVYIIRTVEKSSVKVLIQ